MKKIYATKDITYPDEDKRPVVMWEKGTVVDNEDIANILLSGSPDLVSFEKPELKGKEKSAMDKVKEVLDNTGGKKK